MLYCESNGDICERSVWSQQAREGLRPNHGLSPAPDKCLPCPVAHQEDRNTMQKADSTHCVSLISLQCLWPFSSKYLQQRVGGRKTVWWRRDSQTAFSTAKAGLFQFCSHLAHSSSEWEPGLCERCFLLPDSFSFKTDSFNLWICLGCSLHAYSFLWQLEEGTEFSAARLRGGFELRVWVLGTKS